VSVDGCLACDVNAGRVAAPGGVIVETEHWVVDHTVGSLGVGTLVVKSRRHVVGVGELDDAEAEELGPLLQRVTAALVQVTSPSQIYVCLWSHERREPGHVHFVVQPVSHAVMEEHDAHGPRLQAALFERGEPPDPAAAAAVADRVRALLAVSKS
jgi:diadenosine tetraphosphate (Ap4A) HIT family hydrolase